MQLQQVCRALYGTESHKGLLRDALAKLEAARDLVDRILIAGGGDESPARRPLPGLLLKWLRTLQEFAEEAGKEAGLPPGPPPPPPPSCAEIAALARAIHALGGTLTPLAAPPGHTAYSWWDGVALGPGSPPLARLKALAAITAEVRALERSVPFQTALLTSTMALHKGGPYSRANFAYGTTPYHTWSAVHRHPIVLGAVEGMRASGQHAVVFGSSHGLLVFNAALTWGIPVVGYEILPYLGGDVFAHLARVGRVSPSLASCVVADMLTADVTTVGLVLLTSQCWDEGLRRRVYEHLTAGLCVGAVVVDYLDGLCGMPGWQHAGAVSGEVSWAPSLTFHIFRRCSA